MIFCNFAKIKCFTEVYIHFLSSGATRVVHIKYMGGFGGCSKLETTTIVVTPLDAFLNPEFAENLN